MSSSFIAQKKRKASIFLLDIFHHSYCILCFNIRRTYNQSWLHLEQQTTPLTKSNRSIMFTSNLRKSEILTTGQNRIPNQHRTQMITALQNEPPSNPTSASNQSHPRKTNSQIYPCHSITIDLTSPLSDYSNQFNQVVWDIIQCSDLFRTYLMMNP